MLGVCPAFRPTRRCAGNGGTAGREGLSESLCLVTGVERAVPSAFKPAHFTPSLQKDTLSYREEVRAGAGSGTRERRASAVTEPVLGSRLL